MSRITFIQPCGAAATLEIANGLSVMEGAVQGGVDGIARAVRGKLLLLDVPLLCRGWLDGCPAIAR